MHGIVVCRDTLEHTGYDLATAPVSVTATAFANNTDTGGSPIEVTAKTYFDGLGRPIQTRTEGEGSNKYLVAGTVYDNRGNVKKQLCRSSVQAWPLTRILMRANPVPPLSMML